MIQAGTIYEAPRWGHKYEILVPSSATNGEYIEFMVYLQSKSGVGEKHIHANLTEQFEIIDGTIGVSFGKTIAEFNAGDRIEIPPNVPHINPYNPTFETVAFKQRVSPAHDYEYFLYATTELAKRQNIPNNHDLTAMQYALINDQIHNIDYLTELPIAFQKAILPYVLQWGRAKNTLPQEIVDHYWLLHKK